MSLKNKIIASTPFICVIIYVLIGSIFSEWGKGLLIFLLVPIVPIILGTKRIRIGYGTIILIIYIVLGFTLPENYGWHPGWVIFLTIPIFNIFCPKKSIVIGKKSPKKDDDFFEYGTSKKKNRKDTITIVVDDDETDKTFF